jgi:hypothetical protein
MCGFIPSLSYTAGNVKCDSQASLLTCTFASFCLGCEPKAKVMTTTLDVNATWELVVLLKDKKTIRCKWVYKIKHNENESVSKYKTRLVAKDYA